MPRTPIATGDDGPDDSPLTPREWEVLRYIARGYTYQEVGEHLFISVETVKNHISNALRKLRGPSTHSPED